MKQAPFRKGLELGFTSTPEGGLAARVDNEEVATLLSLAAVVSAVPCPVFQTGWPAHVAD